MDAVGALVRLSVLSGLPQPLPERGVLQVSLTGLPTLSPAVIDVADGVVNVITLAGTVPDSPISFQIGTGTDIASASTRVGAQDALQDAKRKVAATTQRQRRQRTRPDIVVTPTAEWRLISNQAGVHKEPIRKIGNKDFTVPVDTSTFCYQMTCSCGRHRFCKPNDIFQVRLCRICAQEERKVKKREQRKASKS